MKYAILLISVLALSACAVQQPITNFEECIEAGNPAMESYPRQCNDGENTWTEEIEGVPKPCTKEYMPVCGQVNGQDITFANKCLAENEGAAVITAGECVDEEVNLEGACLSFDGIWLEESKECEGMGEQMCNDLGGTFNECASACRNNPEAEICTMQCVLVCEFE
jgi:hypothetical protein